MQDRVNLILARLNTAPTLEAMNVHSYHLHELKGNRKGTWSVTVRANWRITFRFEKGDAYDVNFEDYHVGERHGEKTNEKPTPSRFRGQS